MSGDNDFEGVVKELQQKIDHDEEETHYVLHGPEDDW